MRVKLYESKWLHTVAGELADRFHDSIEAGDLTAVKQSSKDLLEKCKEFFDPEEDDYVIMEIDELIESFDTVDDDEEEVDFLLDQLYDFCDGYNIWISLGNTAEDEPKEPEEEPEPVKEPVEAEVPVEEPAPEEPENTDESLKEDYRLNDVIGWISDHKELYNDFKKFFNYDYNEASGKETNKPRLADVIDWLKDHKQAFADFKSFFKIKESYSSSDAYYIVTYDKLGERIGEQGWEDYEDAREHFDRICEDGPSEGVFSAELYDNETDELLDSWEYE